MAKQKMNQKCLDALAAYRAKHTGKDGKVHLPKVDLKKKIAKLQAKKEELLKKIADIDEQIKVIDSRMNSAKRKELVKQLTTEQLEALVSQLCK